MSLWLVFRHKLGSLIFSVLSRWLNSFAVKWPVLLIIEQVFNSSLIFRGACKDWLLYCTTILSSLSYFSLISACRFRCGGCYRAYTNTLRRLHPSSSNPHKLVTPTWSSENAVLCCELFTKPYHSNDGAVLLRVCVAMGMLMHSNEHF
jgi:hypothetical protein